MPYKDEELQRAAQAKHYQDNKNRYYDASKAARLAKLEKLHTLKSDMGPCMDCGMTYHPYVMEFDHREDEEKIASVSSMLRMCGWDKILAEIAKCDLVCANCHRMRTFNRNGKLLS